jgi:hypothetical protein
LASVERLDPPVEFRFSLPDTWSRKLFLLEETSILNKKGRFSSRKRRSPTRKDASR